MFPVADDFAAIARRLKEIQAEVAQEKPAIVPPAQPWQEPRSEPADVYDDIAACA